MNPNAPVSNRIHRLILLVLMAFLALGGCQIVHKQNIQQGNVLDNEDLERLETGMTKRQVMVLLGSPAVRSPFHADRWDYFNSLALRGGDAETRSLTILFEDDLVAEFHGSYLGDAEITGADLEELEIIDPNTNQPVLPRTERESPTPTGEDPSTNPPDGSGTP